MKRFDKEVNIKGYGLLPGTFEVVEAHGRFFAIEVNGIPWDYDSWGAQAGKNSVKEAAIGLIGRAEENVERCRTWEQPA